MYRYFYALAIGLIAWTGCSPTESLMETSSETRVHTFSFYKDTANLGLTEMTYTILHLADTGMITCADSLCFGTRLDSVVPYITYKASPALVRYHLPDTTIISTGADTLDFSRQPIYLYVQSSDLTQERWYRINIYAHQANPELYVWNKVADITDFTDDRAALQYSDMKAFYVQGKICLYVNNGFRTLIFHSVDGRTWKQMQPPVGLPAVCAVRDIIQYHDTLYYIDQNRLYRSVDLQNWTDLDFSDRSYELVNMLVVFNDQPWCILQDRLSSKLFLGTIQQGNILPMTDIYGLNDGVLPDNFPVSDFAALSFASSSERPRAMVVGGRNMNGEAVNTRWNLEYETLTGYRIVDFSIEQPTFNSLTGISIIQYNGHLIMFGGIDNDLTYRSNILYSYDEGMNWYAPDKAANKLPETYYARQRQTVVLDNDNNIYIIGGQTNTRSFSDVYRGYLNSLKW